MTYILTCGCESEYGGFPCEWDSETRECEPAVAYGCLCDKHYSEYNARPAKFIEPLSNEEIDKLIHIKGVLFEEGNGYLTLHRYNFARAIEKAHGIK